jgi:NAD dependent epimerase/dehydratase family enzyme
VLLASQRVMPDKAIRTGYSFKYPFIRDAFKTALHP